MQGARKILVLGNGLTAVLVRMLLLEEQGLALAIAEDAATAPAAIQAERPELVILDWEEQERATDVLESVRKAQPGISVVVIASEPLPPELRESPKTVRIPHLELGSLLLPVVRLILSPEAGCGSLLRDRVPLGIADAEASIGQHLALLWESEAELCQTAGFFRAGIAAGDHFLLIGTAGANQLMKGLFAQHGFETARFISEGRFSMLEMQTIDVSAILAAIEGALKLGAPLVRVLGNTAGFEQWANKSEDAVIAAEASFDSAVRTTQCIMMCPYHVNVVSGRTMIKAALQSHSAVLYGNSVLTSPFYQVT